MTTTDEALGSLFHELMRLHHKKMSEIFAKHGLYAAQPHLLRILWEQDGRSQNDFVEKLHLQPATISNILKTGIQPDTPGTPCDRLKVCEKV
jgi:MarR family transcriptional regulator, organic hydroperoxide resistance regulator